MQSSADVLRADQAPTGGVKVLVPFGSTERQACFLVTVIRVMIDRALERLIVVDGMLGDRSVTWLAFVREVALRFLDGYAKANRLKPSGITSKETVLRCTSRRRFATSAWTRSAPKMCSR
jgi:hypothetical protein